MSSYWRRKSREVIEAVLAALGSDAGPRQCRQALREAYPFGPREHHPYRMWCAEVRQAMRQRGEQREAPTVTVDAAGVHCGWCRDRGCICCASAREAVS